MSGHVWLRSRLCKGRGLFLYKRQEVGTLQVALGGCYHFTASATDTLSIPAL